MVGGGPRLRPGLVTQAHHGALFLDELTEFDRNVLDALRQPLEDGSVEVARAHGSMTYPARLQLIAAMNPCRCGWFGDPIRACRCPLREPARYMRRVSGPLLDRIDLRVVMPRMDTDELVGAAQPESSPAVAARILDAWRFAHDRNGGQPNASLRGSRLLEVCALDAAARDTLTEVASTMELTARSVHRVLRVARTIADLRHGQRVSSEEILAATSMRDRSLETEIAA
jgi:magnesium chelatase family protein